MAERLVQLMWQEPGFLALRSIAPILEWVNQGGIAGWPKYYHPGAMKTAVSYRPQSFANRPIVYVSGEPV
jgi:hypothetical protein